MSGHFGFQFAQFLVVLQSFVQFVGGLEAFGSPYQRLGKLRVQLDGLGTLDDASFVVFLQSRVVIHEIAANHTR